MTRLELLDQRVDDPHVVSAQQRAAIRFAKDLFLLSRPGSGKTRTVGIRAARLASQSPPARVAATSYTKVAIEQIAATVRDCGVVLGSEHFTGTLHQFLLRYVLYPFGHLPPVNLKRPFRLIADSTWSGWPAVIYRNDRKKRLNISEFHYAADGQMKVRAKPFKLGLSKEQAESEEIEQAKKMKKQARERGLVSMSDAMFYAQKILQEHPKICAGLAARFDELIVDEVQDTSDVQMRCIGLIKASGKLHSLVLVGDLDQSIYGFQGASPANCVELAKTCGLAELPLTENFRSSQAICDITCRFCRREIADKAVGKHAYVGIKPELLLYDAKDPKTAVESFRVRLEAHGLPSTGAVVLARGGTFRDQINGREDGADIGRVPLLFARFVATYRASRTVDSGELRSVERALINMAWDEPPLHEEANEAMRTRCTAIQLLQSLPSFDRSVADWIDGARAAVTVAVATLTPTPKRKPSSLIKKAAGQDALMADEVLAAKPSSLWARTVHDVKGESHDAVLLVMEPARKKRDQPQLWAAPLIGEEVSDEEAEELRIAYVALTRAERYCAIAIPSNVGESALAPYLSVGFVSPS